MFGIVYQNEAYSKLDESRGWLRVCAMPLRVSSARLKYRFYMNGLDW
jgi:hypothetical protein